MTYAPKTLVDLAAFWRENGGANLGIVGSATHTRGYHLGKDRIYDGAGPGMGDLDYSVKTTRDKAGLTNAASAIDFGKLNGSYSELRQFSVWLVEQCRANAPGTRDVREIIYSPDGVKVYGYNREKGYNSLPILGYGDDTHLTHTHISFYRDSELRDKRPIIALYFMSMSPIGGDVPDLVSYLPGYTVTVKATSNVRTEPKLAGTLIRRLATAETWSVAGTVKGDLDSDCGSDQWFTRWNGGRWEYTSRCNITAGPTAPGGFTQAQMDAAIAAAAAPLNAKITDLTAQNTALSAKLTVSEAKVVVAEAFKAAHSKFFG